MALAYEGVTGAWADVGDEAEPPAERALAQGDPALARALGVPGLEEAEQDRVGVAGVDADIGATLDEGDTGGRRQVAAKGQGSVGLGGGGRQGGVAMRWHGGKPSEPDTVDP